MDIFLTHAYHLPWTSKWKWPFTAIIKLGRERTFFNITDYIRLKEECHTPRIEGE